MEWIPILTLLEKNKENSKKIPRQPIRLIEIDDHRWNMHSRLDAANHAGYWINMKSSTWSINARWTKVEGLLMPIGRAAISIHSNQNFERQLVFPYMHSIISKRNQITNWSCWLLPFAICLYSVCGALRIRDANIYIYLFSGCRMRIKWEKVKVIFKLWAPFFYFPSEAHSELNILFAIGFGAERPSWFAEEVMMLWVCRIESKKTNEIEIHMHNYDMDCGNGYITAWGFRIRRGKL